MRLLRAVLFPGGEEDLEERGVSCHDALWTEWKQLLCDLVVFVVSSTARNHITLLTAQASTGLYSRASVKARLVPAFSTLFHISCSFPFHPTKRIYTNAYSFRYPAPLTPPASIKSLDHIDVVKGGRRDGRGASGAVGPERMLHAPYCWNYCCHITATT